MFSFFTGKKNGAPANVNTANKAADATPNPNISVRSPEEVKDLESLIKTGPVTLVLVHADWCGHCQTYKPMWSELENVPGRTANMAMIHHDMVEKSPTLKKAKIPGYPTVLKVYQNGHIEEYKGEEKGKTNAVPNMRDMSTMTKEVTSAVVPESLTLQNIANKRSKSIAKAVIASAAANANPGMTAPVAKNAPATANPGLVGNAPNARGQLPSSVNAAPPAPIKAVVPGMPGEPPKLIANATNPGFAPSAPAPVPVKAVVPGMPGELPKLDVNAANPGFAPSAVSQIAQRNMLNNAGPKNSLTIGATAAPNVRPQSLPIPPLKGGSLMHVLGRALIQAGPASLLFAAQQSFPTKKGRGSTMRLTRKSRSKSATLKGGKRSSNKAIRSKTRKN